MTATDATSGITTDNAFSINIGRNSEGRRVDVLVRKICPDLPLGKTYRAIRVGDITVNGKRVTPGHRLAINDILVLRGVNTRHVSTHTAQKERYAHHPSSSDIDARVGTLCFENEHIIALNKKSGAPLFGARSCQEAIRHYLAARQAVWDPGFIPSALHRLDRNTSGIVCFSVSLYGARTFSRLLRDRDICKHYLALVHGEMRHRATWEERLRYISSARRTVVDDGGDDSGRDLGNNVPTYLAKTTVEPLCRGNGMTLLVATIESGRRHQIRAQAAARGHPLVGDNKYSVQKSTQRYFLHSYLVRNLAADDTPLFRAIHAPINSAQRSTIARFLGMPHIKIHLTGTYACGLRASSS